MDGLDFSSVSFNRTTDYNNFRKKFKEWYLMNVNLSVYIICFCCQDLKKTIRTILLQATRRSSIQFSKCDVKWCKTFTLIFIWRVRNLLFWFSIKNNTKDHYLSLFRGTRVFFLTVVWFKSHFARQALEISYCSEDIWKRTLFGPSLIP